MTNIHRALFYIAAIFFLGPVMAQEPSDLEVRIVDAERWLSETRQEFERAARRVADLSMRRLPHAGRMMRASRGPLLGVTVGGYQNTEPVEGVEILGITPGGAAAESGLQAGDLITSINGESFTADAGDEATKKLLDFMEDVKSGDVLDVEYLRDGKTATIPIRPFAFNSDDFDSHVPSRDQKRFHWFGQDDVFDDMEMVSLTERLGSYFGTSEGLLVVRSSGNEDLKLQDGDVILKIDGRTPKSVPHAIRILGSYQVGEELTLDIMRDKREHKLEIKMLDESQNRRPRPASALRRKY